MIFKVSEFSFLSILIKVYFLFAHSFKICHVITNHSYMTLCLKFFSHFFTDNVTLNIDGVLYLRVVDPYKVNFLTQFCIEISFNKFSGAFVL